MNNQEFEPVKTVKYVVTQDDLDNNRFLREEGIQVGQEIDIPAPKDQEASVTEDESVKEKNVVGDVDIMEDRVDEPSVAAVDDDFPYFVTDNGDKLPDTVEGHKVVSVVGTKQSNGVAYFSVLCDDGCTYDTEAVA